MNDLFDLSLKRPVEWMIWYHWYSSGWQLVCRRRDFLNGFMLIEDIFSAISDRFHTFFSVRCFTHDFDCLHISQRFSDFNQRQAFQDKPILFRVFSKNLSDWLFYCEIWNQTKYFFKLRNILVSNPNSRILANRNLIKKRSISQSKRSRWWENIQIVRYLIRLKFLKTNFSEVLRASSSEIPRFMEWGSELRGPKCSKSLWLLIFQNIYFALLNLK